MRIAFAVANRFDSWMSKCGRCVARESADGGARPPRGHAAGQVLYFTLIRHDFSDWAVAIAGDPASRNNVDSIVELPDSPLGCGANREWSAVRSFRSHRREWSGGSQSTRPILTKIADFIWNTTQGLAVTENLLLAARWGSKRAVRVLWPVRPSRNSEVAQGIAMHQLNAPDMTGTWAPECTAGRVGTVSMPERGGKTCLHGRNRETRRF